MCLIGSRRGLNQGPIGPCSTTLPSELQCLDWDAFDVEDVLELSKSVTFEAEGKLFDLKM